MSPTTLSYLAGTATSPPPVATEQHAFHVALMAFNATRLTPGFPRMDWKESLRGEREMQIAEGEFVEQERRMIRREAANAPSDPVAFMAWFEQLCETGPGQRDPLFPWLASTASLADMRWFLTQEAAGEAGFDDLVALTQIRFPVRPKLEMARNYWDEMGRGHERAMHGGMLASTVDELRLRPTPGDTAWESLALANLMVALAINRRYAYHAVGALGVIEMTAPGRVSQVNEGLKRLDVSTDARMYFQLHAGLDIQHSQAWNQEVIFPLVEQDPAAGSAIAEGALMRLASGARCFRRYRAHFGLDGSGLR
ncbi:MAG: iron-containing redox enzyme family protein [Betaproteobacteria bacterium]